MSSDAALFIEKRVKLVEPKIHAILCYVIECHNIMIKDNVKYSIKRVKEETRIMFEDFLRNRLVENYLNKKGDRFQSRILNMYKVSFSCETVKEYTDTDGKLANDKIDIYISNLAVSSAFNDEKKLYYAIECKRIKKKVAKAKNCETYIGDIKKFAERKHKEMRLPYEGQIAFMETTKIDNISFITEVNNILAQTTDFRTESELTHFNLCDDFSGSFKSSHSSDPRGIFHIYHLLLDYSSIVVD